MLEKFGFILFIANQFGHRLDRQPENPQLENEKLATAVLLLTELQ